MSPNVRNANPDNYIDMGHCHPFLPDRHVFSNFYRGKEISHILESFYCKRTNENGELIMESR